MCGFWLRKNQPSVLLAPMEGVTDYPMRRVLTAEGGYTHCVSEFLRISVDVPPSRVFRRHARELETGSLTESQTPVIFQLLGGDAARLALAAQTAVEAGARAIDLNFGCPAPTVNRHDGGATLLKYPRRINEIVGAVRNVLPSDIPVSAKLRLGWDSADSLLENAQAALDGGAAWLTIHARTRTQGYRPPVDWAAIARVRSLAGDRPVVANGDIWTIEDFRLCREITGCEHFMIGRGAVANPLLGSEICEDLGINEHEEKSRLLNKSKRAIDWMGIFKKFQAECAATSFNENYPVKRLKQWLVMIERGRTHPALRTENLDDFFSLLSQIGPRAHGSILLAPADGFDAPALAPGGRLHAHREIAASEMTRAPAQG